MSMLVCSALLLFGAIACTRATPIHPLHITAGGAHDLAISGEARFDREYKALTFNNTTGIVAATGYLEFQFRRPVMKDFFYGISIAPQMTVQMVLRFTSRSVPGVHLHLQVFDQEDHLLGEVFRDEQVGPEKVTRRVGTLPATSLWNEPRLIILGLRKVEKAYCYILTLDRLK